MDLKKSLEPFIDSFLKSLEGKIVDCNIKIKELESEKEKVIQQQEVLKEQEKTNSANLYKRQQKLDEEIERSKNIQVELENEISNTNKQNKELSIELTKAENASQNAEDERDLAVKERIKQEEKTGVYNTKIDFLKTDFARLKTKEDNLDERERKVKAKESLSDKREKKLIQDEHEVAEAKLDARTAQKRIDFEYKKLNLK